MPSPKGLSVDIGPCIRQLREFRGLTQKDVAKEAKITINFLSAVENGRREASLKVLDVIAGILRIPMPWLLLLGTRSDLNGCDRISSAITNVQAAVREEIGLP